MPDRTMPRRPHEELIAELHQRLVATTRRLSAHVEKHGMIDDREDETLAFAALVIEEARDSGLIDDDGHFADGLAVVPVDQDHRTLSDSRLPEDVIAAGMKVQDEVAEDNRTYVSGETTDWDQGMVAVAIHRAMTRAARLRRYVCALVADSERTTVVEATGLRDAARVYALLQFHAHEGEWMGGLVIAMRHEPDNDFEGALGIFGVRYDADIVLEDDVEPHATATRL